MTDIEFFAYAFFHKHARNNSTSFLNREQINQIQDQNLHNFYTQSLIEHIDFLEEWIKNILEAQSETLNSGRAEL